MPRDHFSHVHTWVFDLDNTLYPPQMRLFDQIERRMTAYVMRALDVSRETADHLRRHYWAEYGTTLAGLMACHDIDPEPFMDEVHDIDFGVLTADPHLAEAIAALPGRKIIYTNGCAPYARNVIEARGLSGLFDAIYGVEHADYLPKPDAGAFARVFAQDAVDVKRAAMFEDEPRNLLVPHALGLRTVLVGQPCEAAHIHHQTQDLTAFLEQIA